PSLLDEIISLLCKCTLSLMAANASKSRRNVSRAPSTVQWNIYMQESLFSGVFV
uniref:Uncharacterized protein n=1 Tax=Denticeps clupeoides TaxID=299321 RepID=A0AAY4DSJ0_9TELE